MTLKRQGERLAGNIARDSDDLLRVAGRLGDHMNLGRVLDLHLKLFARRQRIAAVLRDPLRPHVNDNRVRRRRPHADAFVRLRGASGGDQRPALGIRAAVADNELLKRLLLNVH